MKITALKSQIKNADRVSVFVDGKYSFSLSLDQVVEFRLKKDLELSEADVKFYKKKSDEGKIRARTAEWLLNRPHSITELKEYLYVKRIDADLGEYLIEYFTQKGYLNQQRFSAWYIEKSTSRKKSQKLLRMELLAKGIDGEVINSVFESSELNELSKLRELAKKLAEKNRYADRQKLKRYLAGKGYNYSDINEVVAELDNAG